MYTRAIVLALTLGAGAAACRHDLMSAEGSVPITGQVSAARVADGIAITNGSANTVTYVVSNRAWLGLLASCAEQNTTCARLAAGEKATVKFAAIYGGASGTFSEGVVDYWLVVDGKPQREGAQIIVQM